jgi:hypothetical protein
MVVHGVNNHRSVRAALIGAGFVALAVVLLGQAPPQPPGLTPAAPKESDLRVRLERVGRMPTNTNPTSPAVAGSQLLLIDQNGYLYRWDGSTAVVLIGPKTVPPEVKLLATEPIINVASDRSGSRVYVMFISTTAPRNVPRRMSPREPDGWYLLYEYQFDGTTLSTPRPITALQVRSDGHAGGGLAVLDDGSLLFAAGDNGDSYEDGRDNGQNAAVHLGKIVRINPADGSVSIAALGVRYPQRLALYTFADERWLTFADPGGWVSEEINAARLSDLLTGTSPPNFGWGRNRDGKAREGTFYIDKIGNSSAKAPAGEPGFVDPVAEFGRQRNEPIAVSGPVHSDTSFSRITLLFGDLVSGQLFATIGPPTLKRQDVLRVTIVDGNSQPVTLKSMTRNERPDPRFFNFPDGSAGVLLERTGEFYRISEVR